MLFLAKGMEKRIIEKILAFKLSPEDKKAYKSLDDTTLFYDIKGDRASESEEKELYKHLNSLIPTNDILVSYQRSVCYLMKIILKVKYGYDPDAPPSGSSYDGFAQIEEVD